MAPAKFAAFLAVVGLLTPLPQAAADHPIAGVISLLEKLEVETKQEGEAEAATFQKFQYWCKRSTRRLTRAMKKEKKLVGTLATKIEGLTADIETHGEDIAALEAQLAVLDQQRQRAQAMRGDEHTLYVDDVDNIVDTISATDMAIQMMVDNNKLNEKVKNFGEEVGAENRVIDTFEHMEEGWNADKLSEDEQETNALNAYNLAKQARDSAISTAEASKSEKEGIKADRESEKAKAESDKAEQERMFEADEASLESCDQECKTTTEEYEERSKIRSGELEAMAVAKKILSKVTGVRNPDTHEIPTKALLEATAHVSRDTVDLRTRPVSFLEVRDPRVKAVNLLREAARQAHSKSLQKLAQEISVYDGPFDKIKAMIEKMIFRLMGEQKDEDEHKLWCDMETEKSTESKDDKAAKVNLYTRKVAEMDATIKVLMKQIVENNEKVASIEEYKEQETTLRNENHAEILATIKDSADAQAAISDAISVLKDFYKKSAMTAKEPWEFVQTGSHRDVELPDSPATWDSSYTGIADPNSGADGVLTLLDEVMQKFSKQEADCKVTDESDQKEYKQDMDNKKVEIDETTTDTQMKTSKKDSVEEKMHGMAAVLKSTSSELDAVEQYLKDLEPACGTGDSSYEDRKKARADEADALRKAQIILEEAFRAKALL